MLILYVLVTRFLAVESWKNKIIRLNLIKGPALGIFFELIEVELIEVGLR